MLFRSSSNDDAIAVGPFMALTFHQAKIPKHHLPKLLLLSISKMANASEYTEQQWSDLCNRVKALIPKQIGEEAWYLVIVQTINPNS